MRTPIKSVADLAGHYDIVVIGGGQAGLSAGYFLSQTKADFVILDENPCSGDSWRKRWDSLRLFTPSQLDGLPGMQYPGPENYFPTKDEMADYLRQYAEQFGLPVKHGLKVEQVARENRQFRITAGSESVHARSVVVATGAFRLPRMPKFAGELSKDVQQFPASAYCNPTQVSGERVLVVGAGNSGAEIALELRSAGKQVWLSGRDVGVLPIMTPAARVFGGRLFWWFSRHVVNVHTPIGRKARPNVLHHGHPLGRARRQDLVQAGVELVGRVTGIERGLPLLEDGRQLPVETVIWATGYRPDFTWIDLPVFDEDGLPRHKQGVVEGAPGLYFLGLPFQTAINSSLVGGVGEDAKYIASQAVRRAKSPDATE